MKSFSVLAGALLALGAAVAANAHTPYLAPTSFDPMHGELVTLDAAFAEEFFAPEVVFDNSEFVVIDPQGKSSPADTVQRLKTRAVIEHKLGEKGTYRFSSGRRLGAVIRSWELDGKKESTRDSAKPMPEGAKLLAHYQSVSLSEAYVTFGAPSKAALKPYGNGLELVPITHPGDLYTGEKFTFEIRFDGKPLAGQDVEIFPATRDSSSKKAAAKLTTDAAGKATFDPAKAGIYLALIRYRGKAPAEAAAPEYGFSYTLSFRVLDP
jgi:uncharacterized GH25 family protein